MIEKIKKIDKNIDIKERGSYFDFYLKKEGRIFCGTYYPSTFKPNWKKPYPEYFEISVTQLESNTVDWVHPRHTFSVLMTAISQFNVPMKILQS